MYNLPRISVDGRITVRIIKALRLLNCSYLGLKYVGF